MSFGTPQIFLTTYAFVSILLIILALAIIGVMVRIENKSTATRFLLLFFIGLLVNSLAMFLSNSAAFYPFIFIPTQDAALIAGGIGLVGFAYHYPRYDQPGEARVVIGIFSLVAAGAFIYNLYFAYLVISQNQAVRPPFYFVLFMPLMLLLAIAIFFRRALYYVPRGQDDSPRPALTLLKALWRPPNASVLALRNFGLALSVGIIQAVASARLVGGTLGIHFVAVGAILAISAITLVYFNHAPEPVTFMARIVGITLVTLFIVLGIQGVNLIQRRRAEQNAWLDSLASRSLAAVWHSNEPLLPPEALYVVSWPPGRGDDPTTYERHFERPDTSLISPAIIAAENAESMAQGYGASPAPGEIRAVSRAREPLPADYVNVAARQMGHAGRVYEVGFSAVESYYRPVHQEVVREIVPVILSSLFVLLIFPLFFRRTLAVPLDNLLRGIEQANAGQLDLALPVKYDDEVGFLTRSFNHMVQSLRQSQADLLTLTKTLEQRVARRTAALTRANQKLALQNRQFQETNRRLAHEIGEREQAERRLNSQLRYEEALARCSQALLVAGGSEADNRQTLATALSHLIEPAQVSKIFLYENFADPELGFCSRFIMDACAPGIPSVLDNTDPGSLVIPWSIVPDENRRRLAIGEPVGGPVKQLFAATPAFRDYLLRNVGVLSVQFFPIHFGQHWWGYVGFDDRVNEREWQEEIVLLQTVAELLSSTLQRWRAEADLRAAHDWLEQQVQSRTATLQQSVQLLEDEIKERERAEAETEQLLRTLEARVAARTQELAAFFDLTMIVSQGSTLTEMLEPALSRIIEVARCQAVSVHLLAADRATLHLTAQHGLSPDYQRCLQQIPLRGDLAAWLDQAESPLLLGDLEESSVMAQTFRLAPFATYLCAQLRTRNKAQGVLSCFRTGESSFSLDEISLLGAIAEQVGVMVENQRLRQQIEEVAVLAERQRLARDMHDSISQSLYSLTLFARGGREALEDGDESHLAATLNDLESTARETLRDMRLLLYQLRPPTLAESGLVEALRIRLETVERRSGLEVDFEAEAGLRLPEAIESELYHLTIEAFNNILKHSQASRTTCRLTRANGQVELAISDNGRGFDPRHISPGLGLVTMRERAEQIGADLAITAAPGQGTQIVVRLEIVGD